MIRFWMFLKAKLTAFASKSAVKGRVVMEDVSQSALVTVRMELPFIELEMRRTVQSGI